MIWFRIGLRCGCIGLEGVDLVLVMCLQLRRRVPMRSFPATTASASPNDGCATKTTTVVTAATRKDVVSAVSCMPSAVVSSEVCNTIIEHKLPQKQPEGYFCVRRYMIGKKKLPGNSVVLIYDILGTTFCGYVVGS